MMFIYRTHTVNLTDLNWSDNSGFSLVNFKVTDLYSSKGSINSNLENTLNVALALQSKIDHLLNRSFREFCSNRFSSWCGGVKNRLSNWCVVRVLWLAESLTPQSQSSLQGTFDVRTDIKVLSTKADYGEAGM